MIYGICWHETKELLDAKSFKKYWKNYGGYGLHGWRPPKKVYDTLGRAKCGLHYVPQQIRPHVGIYELHAVKQVE